MMETFGDSIIGLIFDGQTLRIEFGVTRFDEVKANSPITGRRYPACRLVLAPAAAYTVRYIDLYAALQQVASERCGRFWGIIPPSGDTDNPKGITMRSYSKLAVVGAVGLMGIGAATLPAAAATLGYDFTGTPVSTNNVTTSNSGVAYAVDVVTTSVTLTVTGLGVFDNGSTANIDTSGNGHSDTLYIGSGTAPTTDNFAAAAGELASVTISPTTASQVTYWGFGAIASLVLAPGTYWTAVSYGDSNGAVISTSAVTDQSGVAVTGSSDYGESGAVGTNTTVTFGPDFEDTVGNTVGATPLPATFPLFAGGLGIMGLFARRRKRISLAA
jgi:hypothetical protein